MRIGIDLGGTKIEGIALAAGGEVLARKRIPTPAGDYDATIRVICDLVTSLETVSGETGSVGIGMPGTLSPATGRVKNANSTCLNGRPFDRDVMAALGRPVRFANDANCFALSEASDGAAAGARLVFGVILGTGTGGGLVVDGRIVTGANAIGGEWGHNPLPWPRPEEFPGPHCWCGKRGCIETYLSGPGLAADYAAESGRSDAIDGRTIALRAAEGEEAAMAVLTRYEGRLARGLAMVVNIFDPDIIVLGGGLSGIGRLYETVPKLLPRFVFSDAVATRIVAPRHGDASGVRGAAWLWPLETG
jgi:fructokinase